MVASTAIWFDLYELKPRGMHTVETGIWELLQHLLKYGRKPVAGPSGLVLNSSQQSGKQENLGTSPNVCVVTL